MTIFGRKRPYPLSYTVPAPSGASVRARLRPVPGLFRAGRDNASPDRGHDVDDFLLDRLKPRRALTYIRSGVGRPTDG